MKKKTKKTTKILSKSRCRTFQVKRKVGKRTIQVRRKVCQNPGEFTDDDKQLNKLQFEEVELYSFPNKKLLKIGRLARTSRGSYGNSEIFAEGLKYWTVSNINRTAPYNKTSYKFYAYGVEEIKNNKIYVRDGWYESFKE